MSTLQSLLQQRYSKQDIPPNILDISNPVLETVLQHASLRHFSRESIKPELLALLIAAAQSAPTSSNLQAWSLIAVQEREQKQNYLNWQGIKPLYRMLLYF